MTDPHSFQDFDIGQLGEPDIVDPPVPNHRVGSDLPPPDGGPSRSRRLFERSAKGATTTAKTRAKAPKGPPPEVTPGEFVQPLTDIYNTVAMVLMPFKPQASLVMISAAREATEEETKRGVEPPTVNEQCAKAWDDVAQKNESVRRTLKTLTTAGVWGGLFMAHMPIVAAIMADTPAGDAMGALLNPTAKGAEDYLKGEAETP